MSKKRCQKNWARLIRKIYEVVPLVCPKCNGQMRIIAFIEEQEVIKKILTHLGLYLEKSKAFPRAPPKDLRLDSSCSQIPAFDDYLHGDPEYSIDGYIS